MQHSLLVTVKCPVCGGPIRHPEGAYTFKCSFCASVLRTVDSGQELRYVIRQKVMQKTVLSVLKRLTVERKEEFGHLKKVRRINGVYKPYWFFKGMVYNAVSENRENDVLSKTWAHTFQGNRDYAGNFYSLGTRAEVLSLEPFDSEGFGEDDKVLPVTVTREEAEKEATAYSRLSIVLRGRTPVFERTSIIGEKFFLLYYPFVSLICADAEENYQTLIFDGVHGGFVYNQDGRVEPVTEERIDYKVELFPHRCKNCGHDLRPGDFDVFYYCSDCARLWHLTKDDYEKADIRVVEGEGIHSVYLPFWRFVVTAHSPSTGRTLATVGDLAGFMKTGNFLLRGIDKEKPMTLYLPALVTRNAKSILRLGGRFSMFQKDLPLSTLDRLPDEKLWNASLPQKEAEEMLYPILFTVIGRVDADAIKFYNDFSVTVHSAELVWYPFHKKGSNLEDRLHNFQISTKAMDINVYTRPADTY